ncbi:Alpha/Beta hydrolase protein [Phyllosticta citribraziliensis]|uniref:Alpha/Beta hydrolase protein n=1 Tax=Phyllosticta citribraziliensis TaxID=989973 RepID=A0ABR1LCW4_9PEZI
MDSRLELALRALGFCYGVLAALRWLWFALLDGSLLRRRGRQAERDLAAARRRFWDLSASPVPNFQHAFFTTDAGVKLHYVASSWNPGDNPNLVILLHGFPDSWVLWREFLTRQKLDRESVYVALDLPGYGGSDSLPVYNADNVLETVTAFVLGMRERCIQEEDDDRGQVVIVSHDWGAVVASRLASEAPQLADHYIMTSAPIVPLAINNIMTRLASSQRMLHTWTKEPLRLTLLRNAFRTVEPVLSQIRKSSYVFAFRLPVPLIRIVSYLTGTTYLGVVHAIAAQGLSASVAQKPTYAVDALASSLGPSPSQCVAPPAASSSTSDANPSPPDTTTPSLAYPPSVAARARSTTAAWLHATAYYRDGLAVARWTKSLQTILSLSALDPSSSVSPQTSHSPQTSFNPRASLPTIDTTSTTNGGGSVSSAGSTPRRRRSSAAAALGALTHGGKNGNGNGGHHPHPQHDHPQRRRSSLSVGSSIFDTGSGSGIGGAAGGLLRAPATIVVGGADVAFDWRLCLEGMAEFIGHKGGAVVVVDGGAHWVVREDVGVRVLARVVGGVVGAEDEGDGFEGEKGEVGGGVGVNGEEQGQRAAVFVDEKSGSGGGGGGGGGMKSLLSGLSGVRVVVER